MRHQRNLMRMGLVWASACLACTPPAAASGLFGREGENRTSLTEADFLRLERSFQEALGALGKGHTPDWLPPTLRHPRRNWGFFSGLLCTSLCCGLVWWRYRSTILRAFHRERQSAVISALRDLDPETMKQVLGDVNLPSWLNYPDFSRTRWLNTALGQIWPFFRDYMAAGAEQYIGPLLQENKPGFITDIALVKFELGDKPPVLNGVKVYSPENSDAGEVLIELDFSWASEQDVHIALRPVPKYWGALFSGIGEVISNLIRVRVGVEKLMISGRLRIALKPLMRDPPFVGAIQVSLVQVPDFSFDLTVYGGDLTVLPGFESWLYSFIRSSVFRPYVIPERYIYMLVEDANLAELPKGILLLRLLEAENVPRMDVFSKTDAYCLLSVRESHKLKSQTISNSLHPKWDEEFKLIVHDPREQSLTIEMLDHDLINADRIGQATLKLSDLKDDQEEDLWLDLELEGPASSEAHKRRHEKVKGPFGAIGKVQAVIVDEAHQAVDGLKKGAKNIPLLNKAAHDKHCRVRIKAQYLPLGSEEVKASVEGSGAASQAERELAREGREEVDGSDQQQPPSSRTAEQSQIVINTMRGGVLYVRVNRAQDLKHKRWIKGGFLKSTAVVRLHIGAYRKETAKQTGSDPAFTEVLEFLLGADEVEQLKAEGQGLLVEVWDTKLLDGLRGRRQIPFVDIEAAAQMKERFELEDERGHPHGAIEMELRWIKVLDTVDPRSSVRPP